MQIIKRRKKILDILCEKGSLTYDEILDEMSKENEIEILSDIDNLVFFRFIEHSKEDAATLKLRAVTEEQMTNDLQRVISRLKEVEYEIPPWYRKLAVLTVLNNTKKSIRSP